MKSIFSLRTWLGIFLLTASHAAPATRLLQGDAYAGLSVFSISVVDLTPDDGIEAGYRFGPKQHRGSRVQVAAYCNGYCGPKFEADTNRSKNFESVNSTLGSSAASVVAGIQFQDLPLTIFGQQTFVDPFGIHRLRARSLATINGANITVFENTRIIISSVATASIDYDFVDNPKHINQAGFSARSSVTLGVVGFIYDINGNILGGLGDADSFGFSVGKDEACSPSQCMDVHRSFEQQMEVSIETESGQVFKGGFNAGVNTSFLVSGVPEVSSAGMLVLGLAGVVLVIARRRADSDC